MKLAFTGYVHDLSGYGEAARRMLSVFKAAELEVARGVRLTDGGATLAKVDFDWAQQDRTLDYRMGASCRREPRKLAGFAPFGSTPSLSEPNATGLSGARAVPARARALDFLHLSVEPALACTNRELPQMGQGRFLISSEGTLDPAWRAPARTGRSRAESWSAMSGGTAQGKAKVASPEGQCAIAAIIRPNDLSRGTR